VRREAVAALRPTASWHARRRLRLTRQEPGGKWGAATYALRRREHKGAAARREGPPKLEKGKSLPRAQSVLRRSSGFSERSE
jgi:hypothetical protein